MTAPPRPVESADRPRSLSRLSAVALGLGIILLSALLMADRLRSPRLHLDDFAFLAESRTPARLVANLTTPHNAHVVPLFRLAAFVVLRLGGSLANAPTAFTWAAFGVLVLVMLAGGHLVAQESGQLAAGLAAMAGLGLTSVMIPSSTWFSASQPLWSGLCVLLMLIALQTWRRAGGRWRLALASAAAIAAPAFWSGGYAAGPVGLAYLRMDRRPGRRWGPAVPLAANFSYGVFVIVFFGRRILAATNFHERRLTEAAHPLRGLLHTAQAIPETLIFGNLGIDAETTAIQGVLFCLAITSLWLWSHRGRRRPGPLEVAGAALVIVGFLLVYTFRGYLPWESLRSLGWYHALPQIGAVLLAAGWWTAMRGEGGRTLAWWGIAGAAVLAVFLFAIQRPRADRHFSEEAPPLTPSERLRFPTADLRHARAVYFAAEAADRQRRFLARLDRVERMADRWNVGRLELRQALGRVEAPGWPPLIRDLDALDLTDLPESTGRAVPPDLERSLSELLLPEPEGRPPWIAPEDRWPAEPRDDRKVGSRGARPPTPALPHKGGEEKTSPTLVRGLIGVGFSDPLSPPGRGPE